MLELTKKQHEIVDARGKFVVKACPGSGKTFAVTARLQDRLLSWGSDHAGIATLSFTNTAWQEIKRCLSDDFMIDGPVLYPHFLGTIDSFVNQFIFLPFGHLVMGCKSRPTMIGPPINTWDPTTVSKVWSWGKWDYYKYNFFHFKYTADAESIVHPTVDLTQRIELAKRAFQIKKSVNRAGFATQSDANVYALCLLRKLPSIALALASRFPMVMIDEAQDTSAVQMAIIDTLVEAGLSELMLIGDPDQAIYEWNMAEPKLFAEKFDAWRDRSLILNETWRSSQRIAETTFKLSTLPEPSTAINPEVAEFGVEPEVWEYDPADLDGLTKKFLSHCEAIGIATPNNRLAVLTRAKELAARMCGIVESDDLWPWGNIFSREVAEAKHLDELGRRGDALAAIEKGYIKSRIGGNYISHDLREREIAKFGFVEWRRVLYRVLKNLPMTTLCLGEWIAEANKSFDDVGFDETCRLAIKKKGKYAALYRDMTFQQIFGPDEVNTGQANPSIGTVHSVKGQTFDAVMLILKSRTVLSKRYVTLIKNVSSSESEELRIVYVGLTRARKVLVLAVPSGDGAAWKTHLLG